VDCRYDKLAGAHEHKPTGHDVALVRAGACDLIDRNVRSSVGIDDHVEAGGFHTRAFPVNFLRCGRDVRMHVKACR
jgi:hypothetical protein